MYRTAMQGKAIQGDASAMHACMHVCVCARVSFGSRDSYIRREMDWVDGYVQIVL